MVLGLKAQYEINIRCINLINIKPIQLPSIILNNGFDLTKIFDLLSKLKVEYF